ncbi:ClpP/crotonase-like domain-containing protein [Mycena vitilis]|nr:ClpP/crotonase-like domain-containing protein [Mycena vitilis]
MFGAVLSPFISLLLPLAPFNIFDFLPSGRETTVNAAPYPTYDTVQTTLSAPGVLRVVLDNTYSSINLFDYHLQSDLANLVRGLQAPNSDVRVVVFESANPEFFIGHIDVNYFLPGYESPLPLYDPGFSDMLFPVALLWNITHLPQATIAIVEGRARGIGNEFLMSCDMRFASLFPHVLLAQIETSFGVNPGAGGAMYLAGLIGPARALEYVLSSTDVDAATAARLGWINAAFPTVRELHDHVDALARRIAMFPAAGVAATKRGVNAVARPAREVLVAEAQDVISGLIPTRAVQDAFRRFIGVTDNQSVGEMEMDYGRELQLFPKMLRLVNFFPLLNCFWSDMIGPAEGSRHQPKQAEPRGRQSIFPRNIQPDRVKGTRAHSRLKSAPLSVEVTYNSASAATCQSYLDIILSLILKEFSHRNGRFTVIVTSGDIEDKLDNRSYASLRATLLPMVRRIPSAAHRRPTLTISNIGAMFYVDIHRFVNSTLLCWPPTNVSEMAVAS